MMMKRSLAKDANITGWRHRPALECGGKRSATPLFNARDDSKSGVTAARAIAVFAKHSAAALSRGAVQPIRNRPPRRTGGHRFNHDQLRARLVASMQFGIERAGKCLRVVRDDADTADLRSQRNVGVRDHENAFERCSVLR